MYVVNLREKEVMAMAELKRSKGKKNKSKQLKIPNDWSSDMLSTYYTRIVGGTVPDSKQEMYKKLVKTVDLMAPAAKVPKMVGGEPTCFGLYFSTKLRSCMLACPHMPLCRRVIELRPDLKKLAKELDTAADEVDKLTSDDIKEIKKSTTKRKIKKDSKTSIYIVVKSMRKYKSMLPKELYVLYQWMESRKKGFTTKELINQFSKEQYKTPIKLAKETIAYLLSEKCLKIKN